jgi:PPP family 3-phenylpropionic acid transporter
LLAIAFGFWSIHVVVLIGALAAMGLMPIAETLAMSGVRRGGLDYGRMRLWGSVSFIAIGFAAGPAIVAFGPSSVLWFLVAGSLATFVSAVMLPADPDAMKERAQAAEQGPGRRPTFALLAASQFTPRFLLFLAGAAAVQSSHAVFYTFGVIEWQRQGVSATWCATLWAIGVAVEIGLFAFSKVSVARLGAIGLLMTGAVAGVIRWTAMAFDPPLAALIPLQALHGLTFGAAHLGALHFMSANVPPSEAATAQAVYASVTSGIGLGLATLAAGPLYGALGGYAYAPMAFLCVAGTIGTIWLSRWLKSTATVRPDEASAR